jgi:hypothetical protein
LTHARFPRNVRESLDVAQAQKLNAS